MAFRPLLGENHSRATTRMSSSEGAVWTQLEPLPLGSERYGCGCASVRMAPPTTVFSSDELEELWTESPATLCCWREPKDAEIANDARAIQVSALPMGSKAWMQSGLSLTRVGGSTVMLGDGAIVHLGSRRRDNDDRGERLPQ